MGNLDKRDTFVRLQIDFPANATDNVKIGASIAINGTCLTARGAALALRGAVTRKEHAATANLSSCPPFAATSR